MNKIIIKTLIIMSAMIFGIVGCGNQLIIYELDSIEISPYTFYYKYDPSEGKDIRIDTAYDTAAVYPIDSICWEIYPKTKLVASGSTFEFVNAAYAFKPSQTAVPLYELEDIFVVAMEDYNDRYRTGDTLNPILRIIRKRASGSQEVSWTELVEDDYFNPQVHTLHLTEAPDEDIDFSFRIIYAFEDSVFFHQESPQVKLSAL